MASCPPSSDGGNGFVSSTAGTGNGNGGGTCPGGWYSCPAEASGGCCPSGMFTCFLFLVLVVVMRMKLTIPLGYNCAVFNCLPTSTTLSNGIVSVPTQTPVPKTSVSAPRGISGRVVVSLSTLGWVCGIVIGASLLL